MKKMNRKLKTRLKIVGATGTAVFTLFSAFTATYAWFASNSSVTATGMQISVMTPPDVNFELFYLSSFTDSNSDTQDGNLNTTTNINSGYEVEYQNATFTEIDMDNLPTPNPTDIQHLWPAHKLTFAVTIDSGEASKLSLTDWTETAGTVGTPKVSAEQYVRLSWAIDIYGAAYSVTATNSKATDIATAYRTSYFGAAKTDVFNYSQSNLAPTSDKPELDVVGSIPSISAGNRVIVFFTVEFSNASSTYYRYDTATDYYVLDSANGNSNCYESLSLTGLSFAIK